MASKRLLIPVIGLGLVVALGFAGAGIAQQPALAPTPPAATAYPTNSDPVTAKAPEPMVAPIQRVKPAAPKLDPRLSATPVSKSNGKPGALTKAAPLATKSQGAKAVPTKTAAKAVRGKSAAPAPKAAAGTTVPAGAPVTAAGDKPAAAVTTR
jgi:hypothetical protein